MNWTTDNTEFGSHIERGECRLWLTAKANQDLTIIDIEAEEVSEMVEDGFLPGWSFGMRLTDWEANCHEALCEYANDHKLTGRQPTFSIECGVRF